MNVVQLRKPRPYKRLSKKAVMAHLRMEGQENCDTVQGVMAYALQGNAKPIEDYIYNLTDLDDDDRWALSYLITRKYNHKPAGRPSRQSDNNQPLTRAAYWAQMKMNVTRRKLNRDRLTSATTKAIAVEAQQKFKNAGTAIQILTMAQRGWTFRRRHNGFIVCDKSPNKSL